MTEPAPRALIDYGRLLDAIGIEAELLAASAHQAPGKAQIPGCPGLDIGTTVRHVGSLHRVAALWVRHNRPPRDWRRRPDDGDAIGFLRAGAEELVGELARHEPGEPCDTWWPADRTHGFWRRRMAHETAVHRIDVQAAAGISVEPLDVAFAADGIDEMLFLWFGYRLELLGIAPPQSDRAVGLSAADRHWLASFESGRCLARRASAADLDAADAVVSGEPMALLLWLWGRIPHQVVRFHGDDEAVLQLWARLRPATRA